MLSKPPNCDEHSASFLGLATEHQYCPNRERIKTEIKTIPDIYFDLKVTQATYYAHLKSWTSICQNLSETVPPQCLPGCQLPKSCTHGIVTGNTLPEWATFLFCIESEFTFCFLRLSLLTASSGLKESFTCGTRKPEFLPFSIFLHNDSNEVLEICGIVNIGETKALSSKMLGFFFLLCKHKRVFHTYEEQLAITEKYGNSSVVRTVFGRFLELNGLFNSYDAILGWTAFKLTVKFS